MKSAHGAMVSKEEDAAVKRLILKASGDDGWSNVADFLLAWWNPKSCGRFDISEVWGVDDQTAADIITVFALAVQSSSYPDVLGYSDAFRELVKRWRPDLRDG